MTPEAGKNWRDVWKDSALCDRITELIVEYGDAPDSEEAGSLRDLLIDQIQDVVQTLMECVEADALEEAAKVAVQMASNLTIREMGDFGTKIMATPERTAALEIAAAIRGMIK